MDRRRVARERKTQAWRPSNLVLEGALGIRLFVRSFVVSSGLMVNCYDR